MKISAVRLNRGRILPAIADSASPRRGNSLLPRLSLPLCGESRGDNPSPKNTMKTKLKSYDTAHESREGFGVRDSKGREIGSKVIIQRLELVPLADGEESGEIYDSEGTIFHAIVNYTRNGKRFGRGFHQYFPTLAESLAWAGSLVADYKTVTLGETCHE